MRSWPGWIERPAATDARWLIMAFLLSFDIFALRWDAFGRRPLQWAVAISACLAAETVAALWHRRPLRWLSGLISGLGLFLLCDTPKAWPYALLAALAIFSKSILRDRYSHIFNPTNFAMVVGVLWLPSHVVTDPGRWNCTLNASAAIAALGWLTAWRAGRLSVVLSYQGTFVALQMARALAGAAPAAFLLAPMSGPAFQLFSFYMVTDPATSPRERRAALAFGAAVAILDVTLRAQLWLNAPLIALFIVSALRPLTGEAGRPR